jgi:ankyrin repeat protein
MNYTRLNWDALITMLNFLSLPDIFQQCKVNQTLRELCNNVEFWHKLYRKRYNEPVIGDARKALIARYQLNGERLLVTDDIDEINDIIRDGVDVNVRDANGDTPLALAVYYNNLDKARLLLDAGADPNLKVHGWRPVYFAQINNNRDMVRLFQQAGSRRYYGTSFSPAPCPII